MPVAMPAAVGAASPSMEAINSPVQLPILDTAAAAAAAAAAAVDRAARVAAAGDTASIDFELGVTQWTPPPSANAGVRKSRDSWDEQRRRTELQTPAAGRPTTPLDLKNGGVFVLEGRSDGFTKSRSGSRPVSRAAQAIRRATPTTVTVAAASSPMPTRVDVGPLLTSDGVSLMRRRGGSGDSIVITTEAEGDAARARGGGAAAAREYDSGAAREFPAAPAAAEVVDTSGIDFAPAITPALVAQPVTAAAGGGGAGSGRYERPPRAERPMRGTVAVRVLSAAEDGTALSVGDTRDASRAAGGSSYGRPAGLAASMRPRNTSPQPEGGFFGPIVTGGLVRGELETLETMARGGGGGARTISDDAEPPALRPLSAAVSELAIDVREPVSRYGTNVDVVTGAASAAAMEPLARLQRERLQSGASGGPGAGPVESVGKKIDSSPMRLPRVATETVASPGAAAAFKARR
jgi:hypothetical protein